MTIIDVARYALLTTFVLSMGLLMAVAPRVLDVNRRVDDKCDKYFFISLATAILSILLLVLGGWYLVYHDSDGRELLRKGITMNEPRKCVAGSGVVYMDGQLICQCEEAQVNGRHYTAEDVAGYIARSLNKCESIGLLDEMTKAFVGISEQAKSPPDVNNTQKD